MEKRLWGREQQLIVLCGHRIMLKTIGKTNLGVLESWNELSENDKVH